MNETQEKFGIKMSDGNKSFEILGTREFVESHITNLEAFLRSIVHPVKGKGSTTQAETREGSDKPYLLDNEIFDVSGEDINIICNIPGSKVKNKITNVALLYMYAANKIREVKDVDKKEISTICTNHACMDSKNFSTYLKQSKSYFIINGDKVRITIPGITQAENLIKEIHEGKDK
jgi:hypothetical protein